MRFIVEYLKSNRQNHKENSPNGQSAEKSKRNEIFIETEMQKDNTKFENLKRVQNNLEKNAIDELKQMDQLKKYIQKKEQKANKQKLESKNLREQNKQDNNFKWQEAIQRRVAIEKQIENQSMLDFEQNLQDIQARINKKTLRERSQSAQTYQIMKQRHTSKDQSNPFSPPDTSYVAQLPKEIAQKSTMKTFGTRAASSTMTPVHKETIIQEHNGGNQGKRPQSARRPQSSNPILITKPTCQQEYETDYALQKFNLRMQSAMERLTQRKFAKMQQNQNENSKREEILQRLREQHDASEFSTLQNYVLNNRKINKSQKKKLEFNLEVKQQLKTEQLNKTQVIETHKKQNENDLNLRFKMIEAKIIEKNESANLARINLRSNWRLKRETRQLKHLEVMEKRSLSQRLALYEKKKLIEKQNQIRDNYNDLQLLQQNLQQMRTANELRRLELVSHRSQQIKQAKNDFLNQCELEEKKKKAKLQGQI